MPLLALSIMLLVAGAFVARRRRRGAVAAAVAAERRRIARELHDGVAQELAYLVRHAAELSPDEVRRAAGKALAESRRAVADLGGARDEPLEVAVAVAAEEAARRCGGHVDLALEGGRDVRPETREAIARVAGEAVGNALRHASVDRVAVALRADPMRLVVSDTGCGFDPRAASRGYGLTSMRDRVERVGGGFAIDSAPGRGTTIEVVLP
jgi:signal transduction histidine kinase